ncbi:MAG: methylmalonyl-CoA mutase family protein [Bacteroidota bacterium]
MADTATDTLGALDLGSHFAPPTHADWLAGVKRTLRGRAVDEVLQWRPSAGLTLPSIVFGADEAARRPPSEAVTAFTLSHTLAGLPEHYRAAAKRALDLGADTVALWSADGEVDHALTNAIGDRLRVYAPHQPDVPAALWMPVVRPDARPAPPTPRVLLDGAVFTEAGADAVTGLAWHLALANRYAQQRNDHGRALDTYTLRVALTLEPMLDVARLTATRRVFRQFAAAWGLDADLELHAVTSYRYQTTQDVHNNLIRASLQGVAAALAGADVLSVRPYRAGDDEATRWALGLGHLLRSESHFGTRPDAQDAWWISTAAEQIAVQAWAQFQAIEAAGGFDAAWSSADGLAHIRSQHQRIVEALAMGERTLVGTTRFLDESTADPASLVAPNDLPALLESGTTWHTLERVSMAFEHLRERGRKACQQRSLPPVLLVDLDPKRTAQARQLATDFFRMAGLKVQLVASPSAYERSKRLRVACVLGDPNSNGVSETLQTLEARRPGLLRYVVQHPTALDSTLQLHVDDCLHAGMDRLELIHDLHLSLGMV